MRDVMVAMPPASLELRHYLSGVYGDSDSVLAAHSLKWKWEEVKLIWEDHLPFTLRRCRWAVFGDKVDSGSSTIWRINMPNYSPFGLDLALCVIRCRV